MKTPRTENNLSITRFLLLSIGLIAISLACKTVMGSAPVPLPEISPTQISNATPKPITCTDDSCLDACLDRINQVLKSHTLAPLTGAYAGKEAEIHIALYDVKDGQLGPEQNLYPPTDYKKYQSDVASHQRVWNYAASMLPPAYLKWIYEYLIYTDGPSNSLAWVEQDNNQPKNWTLGIDILDSEYPADLTYTLVHEFGHLITLNTDQIPNDENFFGSAYQNSAVCPQFMNDSGCSNPNSYINLFYQKFWKDIYDDWMKMVYKPDSNTSDEFEKLVEQFYSKHAELFVDEYAATSIEEDMAESFMYFVLEPKPSRNTVPDQKILFYYDFSELTHLRQQMIQSVCSYTQN